MGMPPDNAWPFRPTPTPVALAVAMVCGGHRRQFRAHFSPQAYLAYLRSLRNGR